MFSTLVMFSMELHCVSELLQVFVFLCIDFSLFITNSLLLAFSVVLSGHFISVDTELAKLA